MTRRLALGPEVHGDRVRFTLPDPGPRVRSVALEVHPVIRGPKELHRLAPGCAWVLDLPRPDVQRLEYRFRLRGAGHEGLILDPANPGRVATAFGERSVLELPGYAAPTWLGDDAPVGTLEAMMVDGELADPVPVTVWQPHGVSADDPLPLLVVQDGPEYAELAALARFSAALVAGGRLPPHRLALCQPVHRNAWYSASGPYLRTLTGPVLDHLTHRYAGCSPIVVMGASLGGVTALLAATAISGAGAQLALTIALVHVLFNLFAVVLIYGVPFLRELPIKAAETLARVGSENKLLALGYVAGLFFALPALMMVAVK